MGLTTFVGKQPTLKEAVVAKNYLDEKELRAMGQLVSGYLDFAERQAEREQAMTMKDWAEHLDRILTMSGEQLLLGNGSVSHKQAVDKATDEYKKYKAKTLSDVETDYLNIVTKSDLADMMNCFVDHEDNGWLMYNKKYCTADLAYSEIYAQAKKTIYLVDNYIGLRTLVLLKNAPTGVDITLFSDNVGGRLHSVEYRDFCTEYPSIKMTLKRSGGIYHDRFIVLDYGTDDERIFLCGASSKDADARVTSIVEDFGIRKYKALIDNLLKNVDLQLK